MDSRSRRPWREATKTASQKRGALVNGAEANSRVMVSSKTQSVVTQAPGRAPTAVRSAVTLAKAGSRSLAKTSQPHVSTKQVSTTSRSAIQLVVYAFGQDRASAHPRHFHKMIPCPPLCPPPAPRLQ